MPQTKVVMEEAQNWRQLLGQIISDAQKKQRIAEELDVSPVTLARWAKNQCQPRQEHVKPLLEVLPRYKDRFSSLLAEEYPDFFTYSALEAVVSPEIPSAFYGRILSAYTNSPLLLRASSVSILILQQILSHFDPQQRGMSAIIAQCMSSKEGQKVCSLRKTYGRGTEPWGSHDYQTQFYGAESQIGHAVVTGNPTILQSRHEKLRNFPDHILPYEESSAAFPILQSDKTAGCLYIMSTQKNYFTQMHLDLLQHYANLLALAFAPHEFFHFHTIELCVMPQRELQAATIAHFQIRVTQKMLEAIRQDCTLSRLEAEVIVWREIEEELLQCTLSNDTL